MSCRYAGGWLLAAMLLAQAPVQAQAQADEFAWQWPIELPRAGEPAYEVLIDEPVHAVLADPLLRDIAVLDAAGRAQPAAMQSPRESLVEGEPRIESVPWFLLPAASAGPAGLSSGRFESAGVALSWQVPDAGAAGPDGTPELILDLGGDSRSVRAVLVDPAGEDDIWRARIEVLSSSDLQRWKPAAAPTSLYRLAQNGHRLALTRLALDHAPERYLRLRHSEDSARGAISAVRIERRDAPITEREPLRWLRLEGSPMNDGGWQYRLPGALRIEAWNLQAGEGNWVLQAQLSSRFAEVDSWRSRGAGERYQWQIDGERVASPAQLLSGVRDRHWRLQLTDQPAKAPSLLLGYRPDRLLFLAESEPPYRLAAGSGSARRTDAPTRAVLAAIRQQRGKDWQPLAVTLGPRSELAGESALVPARAPIDWKTALLWIVLIAVAGSVIVIALKLLKQPESADRSN